MTNLFLEHELTAPLDSWREMTRTLPLLRKPTGWRVLVVAPHPDDETLGLGGLLYDWSQAGIDIRVLIVSDGGASHSSSLLREIRKAEALSAAEVLGMSGRFVLLGFPDAGLSDFCKEIGEAIRANIPTDGQRCVLLAPRLHDGHPDHDACAIAAGEVAACSYAVKHWSYGVWTWAQAPRIDSLLGARRWQISADGHKAKWKAISMYASQVTGMLGKQIVTDQLLASVASTTEVVWC